jgi:CubicO group peptidase (beta-lactamase class C family)
MSHFGGLPIGEPESVGLSSERLGRISAVMDEAVSAREVPGVVTVVARKGQIAHAHATGTLDIDRPEKLGMDSLFRMYSQSKPITAVVAMTLFEDGVLFLDDPITKWLPEFENRRVVAYPQPHEKVKGAALEMAGTVAANRDLTVFDLMTMTSGLPGVSRTPAAYWHQYYPAMEGSGFIPGDTMINDPPRTYEEMVLALADVPLHSQPGAEWNYGSDFDVLSLLLERASGKPLDELFAERVLDPLGMNDTGFYCKPGEVGRLVTDHGWDEKAQLVSRDRPETAEKAAGANRKLMSGNGLFGGLLSSPPDYGRFAQMLLNGGTLDGTRILGRKTVEFLTTNHIGERNIDLGPGAGWGFGLGYAVRKQIGGTFVPGSAGTFAWGGAAGTWFFVDPVEDMWAMFFTHVFMYQFVPTADLTLRFEKMTYDALI